MKCVILAGGKGTRMMEGSVTIPKPLMMIGDKPILRHIMDIYIMQGVKEFIIPVGYKGEMIYGYFMSQHPAGIQRGQDHVWFLFGDYYVHVVDTGLDTMTGGRLKAISHFLDDRPFHFTYGDGLANVDIKKLEARFFPRTDAASITVVHPIGRFGRAVVNDHDDVKDFGEKIQTGHDWINGGFSVLSGRLAKVIPSLSTNLEKEIYPVLAKHNLMGAVKHTGFWQCIDTLRDLQEINHIYEKDGPVWLKL